MSRNTNLSGSHAANVSRSNEGKVELSDGELDQISGGVSIISIIAGWGETINPFDGTTGGSDDWGKTIDPFAD